MGYYVTMPKASQLWIKAHQSIMRSLARRGVFDGAASSLTSGRPGDGDAEPAVSRVRAWHTGLCSRIVSEGCNVCRISQYNTLRDNHLVDTRAEMSL